MPLFRHETESDVDVVFEPLPIAPPEPKNGLRNFWDQHDYLLNLVTPLEEFGVPVIDAVGLTLYESIHAEEPIPAFNISPGDELIPRGAVVTDRMIGLLTGMGIDKVIARPNPRVVVIALSDKAAPVSYAVTAAAKQVAAFEHRVSAITDSPEATFNAISEQLVRADLLVTVGGFGEGAVDIRQIADRLGPHDFTPVSVTPGRDQGFALAGEGDERIPLLALPADPAAAFVLTKLLVTPVIRHLMGAEDKSLALLRGELAQPVRVTPGVVTCVPGSVTDGRIIISGRISGLDGAYRTYRANALIILDSADGLADTSSETWYLPL
jgi:molybdopterin molybdotransferase